MASAPSEVVVRGSVAGFAQEITAGSHRLFSDEPKELGGENTGPSPYDLVAAALGACTSMTLGMYARRKQWPLASVTVRLRHSKIHANDCADCDTKDELLDRIDRYIELTGDLSDEQQQRLLEIADKCPVHQTLVRGMKINTQLVTGQRP
jgi:putative redox protein